MAKKKEKKYFNFNASITIDNKEIASCDISRIEEKVLNKLNTSWLTYNKTNLVAIGSEKLLGVSKLKVKIERWQPTSKP